ncbi:hypothetical protein ACFQ4C_06815 [Larkinella insperata]|uniref:DUF3408 domain-containing protein n=1 Tax=Larkinella insperata TaxID=332158 RepID=A0ABW3Q5U5_9BACT
MDKPSSLKDVTKKGHADRMSSFASKLIPKSVNSDEEPGQQPVQAQPSPAPAPVPEVEQPEPAQVPTPAEAEPVEPKQEPDNVPVKTPKLTEGVAPKSERKKSSSFSIAWDDILRQSDNKATEDKKSVKYIALTKKSHKVLRDLNYKHDIPMNVILNNLLEVLGRVLQKEESKQ